MLGYSELAIVLFAATALFCHAQVRDLLRKLAEGIDNFRGGPGSPSHPIPANDSRILNRRRLKFPTSRRNL
jgi:hypothetical protein